MIFAPMAPAFGSKCPITIGGEKPSRATFHVRQAAFAMAAIALMGNAARGELIKGADLLEPKPAGNLLINDHPALWQAINPVAPGCDPFLAPGGLLGGENPFNIPLGANCGETRWYLSLRIDHFTEPPKEKSLVRADGKNPQAARTFATDTVLGGERDVAFDRQAGVLESDINRRKDSTDIDFRADAPGRGRLSIVWDGEDEKTTIDTSGLGGVDLTRHDGHPHEVIRAVVGISETNVPGSFTLRVYLNGDKDAKHYVESTVQFEASVKDVKKNEDPRRVYYLYSTDLKAFGFEPPKKDENANAKNARDVQTVIQNSGAIQLIISPKIDDDDPDANQPHFVHTDFVAIEVPHVEMLNPNDQASLLSAFGPQSLWPGSDLGLGASAPSMGGLGAGFLAFAPFGSPFTPGGYPGTPGLPWTPQTPGGGGGEPPTPPFPPPNGVPEPGSLVLVLTAAGLWGLKRFGRQVLVKRPWHQLTRHVKLK